LYLCFLFLNINQIIIVQKMADQTEKKVLPQGETPDSPNAQNPAELEEKRNNALRIEEENRVAQEAERVKNSPNEANARATVNTTMKAWQRNELIAQYNAEGNASEDPEKWFKANPQGDYFAKILLRNAETGNDKPQIATEAEPKAQAAPQQKQLTTTTIEPLQLTAPEPKRDWLTVAGFGLFGVSLIAIAVLGYFFWKQRKKINGSE
jgi:hypothetical protein